MKKVVIVGVGALGSHVAMMLRGEAELRLVDFDTVEAKNTEAQLYGKRNVRQLKVTALEGLLKFIWPETKVVARPTKLTPDNVNVLLEGVDVVIDCVDNGEARKLIQRHLSPLKVRRAGQTVDVSMNGERAAPVLHGGLAANGAFGRVAWGDAYTIDDDAAAGTPTCEGGEHLPFIALVSSFIAFSAQSYLRHGRKDNWMISPAGAQRV